MVLKPQNQKTVRQSQKFFYFSTSLALGACNGGSNPEPSQFFQATEGNASFEGGAGLRQYT